MKIELKQEDMERVVGEKMTQAVESALGGFQVQKAVAEAISEEVAGGAVVEAVRQALREVDQKKLVAKLAEEIEKSVTSATVHILREGLATTIFKLRGVSEYSTGGKDEMARIRAEIFGGDR